MTKTATCDEASNWTFCSFYKNDYTVVTTPRSTLTWRADAR